MSSIGAPIAYPVGKTPEVWAALVKGFGADIVAPQPGQPRRLALHRPAILGGLQYDMAMLLREARLNGAPYIFVDNGYFRTHHAGKRIRYRVVPSAYCHYWINEYRARDASRLAGLGLEVKPWRPSGRHVLVYLSSATHARFFGLERWAQATVDELRRHTDRPIVVRRKHELGPLERELAECWAVVTWSSKLACEATLAGIPAFTGPESGASVVSAGTLAMIERPSLCEFRQEWASALAWGQFTVDEIASGLAATLAREAARSARSLIRAQAHA